MDDVSSQSDVTGTLVAHVAPGASPEQSLVAVHAFVQTPQSHVYPFEQSDAARHTSRK
jgi:hypothetical protein